MSVYRVTLTLREFGEARTGVWCDECMLPSAVEQDFLVDGDVRSAGTARVCLGVCGSRSWTTWTPADVDLRELT